MATVLPPRHREVTASFAGVAKHYGAWSRSARLGTATARAVEKATHAAQRWWRTLADDVTVAEARVSRPRCASGSTSAPGSRRTGGLRSRFIDASRTAPPGPGCPFPATITVGRRVAANAGSLTAGLSTRLGPTELAHSAVTVTARLGDPT